MRVAIEMFSIVIAITLGCILFASFISSNNQVSNARDFYNVAVNRIEDSNCNDQVISQCKMCIRDRAYTLEQKEIKFYKLYRYYFIITSMCTWIQRMAVEMVRCFWWSNT